MIVVSSLDTVVLLDSFRVDGQEFRLPADEFEVGRGMHSV
jgi:hypothetical protein